MAGPRYTLADLAARVAGRLVGDPTLEIHALAPLGSAERGTITHLSSAPYRRHLAGTRASAVILREADLPACKVAAIVVRNPYLAFARISRLFDDTPRPATAIHESAVVDASVVIGDDVAIGPHAVVEADAVLGNRVRIGANSFIGARAVLGDDVDIRANVVIYHRVKVGARSVIHSGAVIGADGFGFTPDETGKLEAIAQLGTVRIGEDVSIGASTTIDRGAIEDTVIGTGVKIDDQVMIGHNCVIGDHTLICGCVGMAGSTRIGKHCVLAGGVGIAGNGPVDIADRVIVGAMTHVARSIERGGVYSGGVPAANNKEWRRNMLRFGELDTLAKRIGRLERLVADVARGATDIGATVLDASRKQN
jgi:UDP-3-O-[3-hydroxymyristoyl] glucosamine N-acyltransferase